MTYDGRESEDDFGDMKTPRPDHFAKTPGFATNDPRITRNSAEKTDSADSAESPPFAPMLEALKFYGSRASWIAPAHLMAAVADGGELARRVLAGVKVDRHGAESDSVLIDAIAEAGVVVRPVDIGGDRRFCAEANGKVVASEHFPTWRASALAGLARARGETG